MTTKQTKAVIWDMDGVIADTAPYHFKAWQGVFRKAGVNFTEEHFRRNFGQRNDTIIKKNLGDDLPAKEIAQIAQEKEQGFRQNARGKVKPHRGVIKLVKSLQEHGFAQAIGSSAPIENIELVIQELDIATYFQAIVFGQEVKEGKPSPMGFVLAAKKLNVPPQNCIVIEDSVAGVTAAKSAGMYCLAVTNTNHRTSLNQADLVVDSLEEVAVSDLESLLSHDKNNEGVQR
jgi:beta-phosphoglucomutase family hydrolase